MADKASYDLEDLKKRIDLFKQEGLLIEQKRKAKKWGRFTAFVFFPFHLAEYLYHLILFLIFRSKVNNIIYAYQKRFFKRFFKTQSIFPNEVFPIPQAFKKPTLIFTNRISPFISPFLLTLFSCKVHIPVQDQLQHFPLSFKFPFFYMGRFIYSFGYRDANFPLIIESVYDLLETKRPVISFLNKGYASQYGQDMLQVYQEVLDFVRSDVECYFLKLPRFELNHLTTFFEPNFVSATLVSKHDLFKDIDVMDDSALLDRLVFFFNFRYCKIV